MGKNNSNNLSEETYLRLRRDIVQGLLRPNERLVEAELAERLAVSRTPVRESLQRLVADGLVVSRRRGWVVHEHTPDEIRQIYEIRGALEGYAARLAAERATDEQLTRILAAHEENKRSLQTSIKDMVEENDRFHDAVNAASNNPRLAELIERNRLYFFNYNLASLYSQEELSGSVAQHEEMVRALLDRNAHQAEVLTRKHVHDALALVLGKVR